MAVVGPDVRQGAAQIVAKVLGDEFFELLLAHAATGEEDGRRDGLCALDTLWMVVGDSGIQHVVNGIKQPADSRNAHGRTVAEAAIGLRVVHPAQKTCPIPSIRITQTPLLHGINHALSHCFQLLAA